MQGQNKILRMAGVSGILLALVQLTGIIMHGSIPVAASSGLAFIHNHSSWWPTHIMLITSYLLTMAFYEGLSTLFNRPSGLLETAGYFVRIGAFLGAIHFSIHLFILNPLAHQYHQSVDLLIKSEISVLFSAVLLYAHVLIRFSFLLLMLVAIIFSIDIRKGQVLKKWKGSLGIIVSCISIVSVLVGELFLSPMTTDFVFAISILPTIAWLLIMGFSILKYKPAMI